MSRRADGNVAGNGTEFADAAVVVRNMTGRNYVGICPENPAFSQLFTKLGVGIETGSKFLSRFFIVKVQDKRKQINEEFFHDKTFFPSRCFGTGGSILHFSVVLPVPHAERG